MKLKYLVDSNIVIDHLNRKERARHWFYSVDTRELAVSFVTCAEVLAGCAKGPEESIAREVLEQFHCFYADATIVHKAADLRRAHGLKLPDAFQAALAVEYNLTLVTRNTKDFPPKQYSFVHVPYTL